MIQSKACIPIVALSHFTKRISTMSFAKLNRTIALLAATTLAAFLGAAALTTPVAAAPDTTVVLSNQTFTTDATIVADRVILSSGCKVRIKNGARVHIRARVLEIHGPCTIDGRGHPGRAGETPSDWVSSGPCSICPWCTGEVAHDDWAAAGGLASDRGGNGGSGGAGSVIVIEYESLVLSGVDGKPLDLLTVLTGGGAGGPPGHGRKMVCGCHPADHVKYAPRGTPGAAGVDGKFTLRQVPPSTHAHE